MNDRTESPDVAEGAGDSSLQEPCERVETGPDPSLQVDALSPPLLTTEHAAAQLEPGRKLFYRRDSDDWLSGIQWLCSTLVLAIFVITFIAQAFQIPSESMENTLLIGDYLLVDKVHFGQGGVFDWLMPYREIQRGDIIVFRYPVHPTQHFVKRVVGVPGDRVHLYRGTVFVNDKPLDDAAFAIHKSGNFDSYRDNFPDGNYISPEVNSSWWVKMHEVVHHGEIVVPPDNYFVLGDNRDESLDSRYWGFVPRENIIGRPWLIYWSVERPDVVSSDGRLERLLYTLVHLPEDARWDRTFHLVR
jgi:signal peptidase I